MGERASSYRGAYRVPVFNESVGVFVRVCLTFVVFTGCGSCTRPISTNQGSMEAGEYRLTRWTRFVARCLEVIAVAGLMWVGGVFSVGRDFIDFFHYFAYSNWSTHVHTTAGCERWGRLDEGATTASQSATREHVHTYPHQVYHYCSPT